MTARFYTNDGGLALSAATLNSLEADVDKGISAFNSVGTITLNSWQPGTVYAVNRYVLNPDGVTVKTLIAHTSGSVYDASKFSLPPVTGSAVTGGAMQFVKQNTDGSWPARPTTDGAVMVLWIGWSNWPAIVASGTAGMRDNADARVIRPAP